jgi:uncharacterized membrane protein YoaK (UPF0700 family)
MPPPLLAFELVLLTLAAASADTAGYLGLGKIFTANMTGNIVLLGISISQEQNADSSRGICALTLFIVGTCLGGWFCHRGSGQPSRSVTLVFAGEAVLLALFAICWWLLPASPPPDGVYGLIALLGLSMGLQGAAVFRLGVPGVVTTVVTGTLTSLLTGVMKTLVPTLQVENPARPSPFGVQAAVVLAYGVGATLSGLLVLHARPCAGILPAFLALTVVLVRLGRRD